MYASFWIVSVLATTALAAPVIPIPGNVDPASFENVEAYFQILAQQAANSRSAAPACNLANAVQPVAPNATALAPPSAGLYLKHVAIGRGTQNYSCATSDATTIPAAVGANATLFNASCIAASYPLVLASLPNVTLQYNSISAGNMFPAVNNDVTGQHFFLTTTEPFFNLDTPALQLGQIPAAKLDSTAAPATASKGQGGVGYGAVPWLKLVAKAGATGGLQEVYRLNTAGGAAPATCAGMAPLFQIQYAAEYWFYATS